MSIQTAIPQKFVILGLQLLHMEAESGYGPHGKHTRQKWREACIDNLKAGKEQFKLWQEQILLDQSEIEDISFNYMLDGEQAYEVTSKYNACTLDFIGQNFGIETNFEGFEFLLPCLFANANFHEDCVFISSYFQDFVEFQSAVFHKYAWFDGAYFASNVRFDDAKFFQYAGFNNTVYKLHANFSRTQFKQDALFSDTLWVNGGWFDSVNFLERADFTNSEFLDDAFFENAQFIGVAQFSMATFHSAASFSKGKFQNDCGFVRSEFWDYCNFDNTVFKYVGHFEFAQFHSHPPGFRGCDIATTRLEFSDDQYFPNMLITPRAAEDISFLKRLSEEQGQTDQVLNFNALELRAKAASDVASWNFKIVTWLYQHLSDFGRSFLRPLTVYIAILFITFLIALEHAAFNAPRNYTQSGCEKYIWWIERVTWVGDKNCQQSDKEKPHKLTGVRAAGEYTLYRAVGVLDFADSDKQTIEVANRLFAQDYEPWWMRIYGIFKAIASTALLFLAALGLRNKYRIK